MESTSSTDGLKPRATFNIGALNLPVLVGVTNTDQSFPLPIASLLPSQQMLYVPL